LRGLLQRITGVIGKIGQVLLQLLITLADSPLVSIVHLHFLLQDEDEFRAPISL
jgi:hypothetical protein